MLKTSSKVYTQITCAISKDTVCQQYCRNKIWRSRKTNVAVHSADAKSLHTSLVGNFEQSY